MSKHSMHTIIGNLADDPELRFTPSGLAVANFRMAVSDRYRDQASGEWKDTDPSWYSVIVWREQAENVCQSLTRGNRVIVTGDMRQRSYENKEGDTVYVWELTADSVGPSLEYATAEISKVEREKPAPKDEVSKRRASASKRPASKGKRDDDEPPF